MPFFFVGPPRWHESPSTSPEPEDRKPEPEDKKPEPASQTRPAPSPDSSAEPPPKRQKQEEWPEQWKRMKGEALSEMTRDDMLDALFNAWDRDGDKTISIEEILPHYMKSCNHQDDTEPKVRRAFGNFMKKNGQEPTGSISPALFRKWLEPLSDDGIVSHYLRHCKGVVEGGYKMNLSGLVTEENATKSLRELVELPISAIRGLHEVEPGEMDAISIRTVKDLGTWRFFLMARAICTLAQKENADLDANLCPMNIKKALDVDVEGKSLKQLKELPVTCFNYMPDKGQELMKQIGVTTISELADMKSFAWANAMVELAEYEA